MVHLLVLMASISRSARDFVNAYHQHCAVMVDAVSKYDFNEAGDLLCEFWGAMAPRYIDLLTCPHIIDIVLGCDAATFEACGVHMRLCVI